MKTAIEYTSKYKYYPTIPVEVVNAIIEEVQIEAYNEAIVNASQKAYDFIEFYQEDKGAMEAIKQSILKLKK